MAASSTDVCNSALVKIGVDTISALSDNTKQAKLCNARYQYIVDELLRSHPWNFAKKRVSLALDPTAPAFYFTQRFRIPSDYVRLLFLDFNENDIWTLEGQYINCFVTNLNMLYIFKNYDTTQWDQLFEEAVAWRLAADISYALVQSATLSKQCWDAYKEVLAQARSMNAQERGSIQQVVADDWMNIRGGMWSDPSKF